MSDLPLTRRDFQVLADLRVEEAAVLVQNRKQQGAYYLAGYAVECALKACIAKKTKRHEFPPKKTDRFYSHNLESLLEEAGLKPQLDKDLKNNVALAANWGVVKSWKETSRYDRSRFNGRDLYTAITSPDGVLAWIKQRW